MLKKITKTLCLSAFAVAVLSTATPVLADEVTLSAASCFPIGSSVSKPFEDVVKEINERGKGVVQIDLKGGAPAIGSPFTMVQKMSKGVYDFVGCTESYFGNVTPEVSVLRLTELTYADLRKNGGFDMVSDLLAAKGVKYIGRYDDLGPFQLFLSKKIDSPDLTGLNLRVAPVYTAFFTAMGATVQTATISEIYTYMENGTVQGFGWPTTGWIPTWAKVTKYRVEPSFYSGTLQAVANLKKWDSLSKEAQKIITDVVLEFEAKNENTTPEFQARMDKQNAWTASQGVELIKFTGADAEKWSTAAKSAAWGEVIERSPEHGKKLMELFTK